MSCLAVSKRWIYQLYAAKSPLVDVVFVSVIATVPFAKVNYIRPSSPCSKPDRRNALTRPATMPSGVEVFTNDTDKLGSILSYQTIITQCYELGPRQATATNISGVRISLDKKSDNEVSNIWVKFWRNITMGKAKTQRFVAQYLRDSNNPVVCAPRVYLAFTAWSGFGCIVTE